MHPKFKHSLLKALGILSFCLAVSACQHGGQVLGNDGGSEPVNDAETLAYKKAILKCYKTGGSRVVKIEGRLRCY